ncbi:MAG TPA: WGxxGxxG family protein [Pyrinomonadaceae bacterium]|nr:WGxxGxxG family protein [Pyrinomonadaceae bacterium]
MLNEGRFSKFLRVGLLSLTLFAVAAMPLAAQTNDNANTNRAADTRDDDRRVVTRDNRDDDKDWGWLGLLGLAGLLGLMPRKKQEVHVRETRDVRDRDAGDRR